MKTSFFRNILRPKEAIERGDASEGIPVNTALHNDIRRSAFLGPIRVLSATLCYIVLYPVIIARSGIDVLGLWSLLVSISIYAGLSDVGFSVTLTRKISRSRLEGDLRDCALDYSSSILFYKVVTVLAMAACGASMFVWQEYLPSVYPSGFLILAAMVLVLGSGAQLIAQLDVAVLKGFHETYFTDKIGSVLPIIRLILGAAGAVLGHPIEGLAAALLLENVLKCWLCRRRRARRFAAFNASACFSTGRKVRRICPMICEGKTIYAVSLGSLLRDPTFRIILTLSTGLAGAAVYDVSRRIPELLRAFIIGGAQAYLPAFSRLVAQEDRASLINLTKLIVSRISIFAALVLGGYFACGDILLRLWLPAMPLEVYPATKIMAFWAAMVLLNVPYWYLMQAAMKEKYCAASLWLQTGAILLLLPFVWIAELSILELVAYWCVTSIATQVLLYYFVQRELKMFWGTFRPVFPAVIIALVIIYVITFVRGIAEGYGIPSAGLLLLLSMTGFLVWAAGVLIVDRICGPTKVA